jgi:SAM-dependent methyltransferase
MSKKNKESAYTHLAPIYDFVMRSVSYSNWASYIHTISKKYAVKNDMILELGCGTGKFANYFKKYYPHIILSDISLQMLKQNKNPSLVKLCCSMTASPIKSKFKLIYSTFDSINYLLTKKNLRKLFTEIALILDENGIFTFDASLEKNSLKHLKMPVRSGQIGKISYEQKSYYFPSKKIHKNVFDIKLNENICFTETHLQKIFDFEEYFKWIDAAGLYVEECYDAFSFKQGSAGSERIQFIVKKNKYAHN